MGKLQLTGHVQSTGVAYCIAYVLYDMVCNANTFSDYICRFKIVNYLLRILAASLKFYLNILCEDALTLNHK